MKNLSLFFLLCFTLLICACSQGTSSIESEPKDTDKRESQETVTSNYPEKPIEVIFPFPTGSAYDAAGRIFTKYAEKYLPTDQSLAVINKTGGGNTAGMIELFNADPDGYVIGFLPTSLLTVDPHRGNVPYDHDGFQPLMRVLQNDGFMLVRDDAPWKTIDEWIEDLKENPGSFAVAAVHGAIPGLEAIKKKAGIEFDVVPYDGFAECTTALLGGHVDATIATLSAMQGQIDAGKVKAFFSTSGKENDIGVPTLQEAGIDYGENKMVGFFAPKELPQELVDLLHNVFKQTIEDPEFQEEYEKAGLEVVYAAPDEFQKVIAETSAFDKEVLELAGMIE